MNYLKYFESDEYYGHGISDDNIISAGNYIESQVKFKGYYDWEYIEPDLDMDEFYNIDYYYYYSIDKEYEDSIDKIYKLFEELGIKDIKIGEGSHSSSLKLVTQTEFIVSVDVDNIKKFSDIGDEYEKYNLM